MGSSSSVTLQRRGVLIIDGAQLMTGALYVAEIFLLLFPENIFPDF